mgnify:CR=1 FL=1
MNRTKGFIFLTSAAFFFAFSGILPRVLNNYLPPFLSNTIRTFMVCLIILPIVFKRWKSITKQDLPWIVAYTIASSMSFLFFYLSMTQIVVTTGLFIFYSISTIAGYILAKLFLNEKLTMPKIVSLLLSFVGILIIYQNSLVFSGSLFPVYFMVASGFLYGVTNLCIRKIGSNYPVSQLNILYFATGSLISLVLSQIVFREAISGFTPISILFLIIFAIVNLLATISLINGFKNIDAQSGSIILLSEIPFGSIMAFLFFSQIPTIPVLIGGAVILVSQLIPVLVKSR